MIEKVIKFKASNGSLWDTEEEANGVEFWFALERHIQDNLQMESYEGAYAPDVIKYLQDYSLFIYGELRKIIPKEQLKELDKE